MAGEGLEQAFLAYESAGGELRGRFPAAAAGPGVNGGAVAAGPGVNGAAADSEGPDEGATLADLT